jgi:hypothetical protein
MAAPAPGHFQFRKNLFRKDPMSLPSIPPQSPSHSAGTTSPRPADTEQAGGSSGSYYHPGLSARSRSGSEARPLLAPRNLPPPSSSRGWLGSTLQSSLSAANASYTVHAMQGAVRWATDAVARLAHGLVRPFTTTPMPFTPVATGVPVVQPQPAPSGTWFQAVPLARMEPEDARAALLAMGVAPQYLDAMWRDLGDCANPFLAGSQDARKRQFVANYSHLVLMPNGLDEDTMAKLSRMLEPPAQTAPEPVSSPRPEAAAQPQQRVSLAGGMAPEDALQALQALGVTPQQLSGMARDLADSTHPFIGGDERKSRESGFVARYGHLLDLPQGLDPATVQKLNHMLADVTPAPPRAAAPPPPEPAVSTAPAQHPSAQRVPLDMDPADALQALRSLGVQEQQLHAMARDLDRLWDTSPSGGQGDDAARAFAGRYGHLVQLPQHLDVDTLLALSRMLASYTQPAA